ncbi:MAG TPA: DUF2127 domain-containing protein [Acidimicrobiales bacterium]
MKSRPPNRYELLTCGWMGHILVGTDAAEVSDADPVLLREYGGLRWHHCLRCESWVPRPPPQHPTRQHVPVRDDVELPLRGPLLRDRYVLRLIALDRAVHVVLLASLAFVIFFFVGNHAALQRDYNQIIQAFGGPSKAHPFLGRFRHYFTITPRHLDEAGAGVAAFAALEAVEMVGLWFAKRWAEYLTFIATAALLPLEVYELTSGVSVLKLVTFVINLAIALYLLWAKRLFGLHGGGRAEEQRRRAASDWGPLEAGL